jgi:hypothetical protein
MNRAKFVYEALIGTTTLLGGVVGSSTFAYESRHDGPVSMFGAAVFGGAVGAIGGAIAGATAPIAIPGVLLGSAYGLSESGSKKLIDKMNEVTTGPNGSNPKTSGTTTTPATR